MKHYTQIVISILFLLSCSTNMNKKVKTYKLAQTYTFPTMDERNVLYHHNDSSTIFIMDSIQFYKIAGRETFEDGGELIYDSVKWYYIAHEENAKEALFLKSLNDSAFSFADLDSFYKTKTDARFLDSAVKASKQGDRINHHSFKKQQRFSLGIQGFETVDLFFDKAYKNLPLSLSPTIDSIFGSKLVSARLVVPKKDFPKGTPDYMRVIEIRLQKLEFTSKDSAEFYFKNRVDSFYSNIKKNR